MSSTPLQCFFCQHTNPANASFCNGCGSQLNLQPCPHCSAVDNRSATHCYKCGAAFSQPKPLENTATQHPALLYKEHIPALRYPAYTPVQPQPLTTWTPASTKVRPATSRRRTWGVAVAALGMVALALPIFYVLGSSAPTARHIAVPQPVIAATTTVSTPQASAGPDKKEKEANQAGEPVTATAVIAISARQTPAPAPTPAPIVRKKSPQPPPTSKECPPAVAALGLCIANLKQE